MPIRELKFPNTLQVEQLQALTDAELVEYFQERVLDHGEGTMFGSRFLILRGQDYLGASEVVDLFANFYGWVRPNSLQAAANESLNRRNRWTAPTDPPRE